MTTRSLSPTYPPNTIVRERVTWIRWDARGLRFLTSHPWVWTWTDEEGYERCYDTKREAEEAKEARDAS